MHSGCVIMKDHTIQITNSYINGSLEQHFTTKSDLDANTQKREHSIEKLMKRPHRED